MEALIQDIGYSLRRLRKGPGFAVVAVATLALGIGANAAIFSAVNAVLLRPLPYPEPDRLMVVNHVWKGRPAVVSPQNFLDFQQETRSFEALAVYDTDGATLTGRGEPVQLATGETSAAFFDVLHVTPALGRGFRPGENEPGRNRVVVLSHGLWRERFGADPAVVGQSVMLDGVPHEVIGVAPPGFDFPRGRDFWRPLEYDSRFRTQSRGAWYLSAIGRLRAGVSPEAARAEASTIGARLAAAYPEANEGVGLTVRPLHEAMVGKVRTPLVVLLGAVGLVLLIACANVANLLLSRAVAREGELAVRSAMGAGRGRLVRQLLTEAAVLGLLGAAAGLVIAAWGGEAIQALQPRGVPRLDEIRLDRVVVAFTLGCALLTTLVFGTIPALLSTRRSSALALREGGRGLLSGRGGHLRRGLAVAEMGLAVTLLAGAGLLLRSFAQLSHVDPGFESDSALVFHLSLPDGRYADDGAKALFYRRALETFDALPGVQSSAATMGVPLRGFGFSFSFAVDGRPEVPPAQQPTLETRVVTASYFRTLGIPLVRGRGFAETDDATAPRVVVISREAARRYFAGEDPVGKRIRLGWGPPQDNVGGTVIGVVGDVKEAGLDEAQAAEIYLPYAQKPMGGMDVVVRTTVPPLSLAPAVRAAVHDLDPDLPVARIEPFSRIVAASIAEPRFYTTLLTAFAGTALLLAALGLFGVISVGVSQRTREIGVRMALGAHSRDVLRLVLREATALAVVGIAVGLAAAFALSRTLSTLLFDLSPRDPVAFLAAPLVLLLTAVIAALVPARRAARVDPIEALRSE
jgi:putative ABC transport system permease protein